MKRYSPFKAPDAAEWLAMDEGERVALAEDYHRRKRVPLPSPMAHAAFHAIVENQIALGVTAVVETLARLQEEGLDRHDAVHAICSILCEFVYSVLKGTPYALEGEAQKEYENRLKVLTARSWHSGG